MSAPPRPGTLYVVATPLGNLGDLSARASAVLSAVAVVAAEDTRRTRPLLAHVGSRARLVSFHAHSRDRRQEAVLEILREGRDVALVSDAGTPLVSDPGAGLVRAAHAAGLPVVPVPGPSAVVAALSAAGLPADRFLMLGFVPRRGRERNRLLGEAAASRWTVVFYEAPARLADLLNDLGELAGPAREGAVARELTKVHEEIRVGPLAELAAHYAARPPLGECTVLLAGRPDAAPPEDADREAAARELALRLAAEGRSRREIARALAEELGLPRNAAYRLAMALP